MKKKVLFFALEEDVNPALRAVLEELKSRGGEEVKVVVFQTEEAIRHGFENGCASCIPVALYPSPYQRRKHFTHHASDRPKDVLPAWAQNQGVKWGVEIGGLPAKRVVGCANQIMADFVTQRDERLNRGQDPWGPRKSKNKRRRIRRQIRRSISVW